MPTPFMHLNIVERMLAHSRLRAPIRALLEENLPAFYLGNVAPDYQTICDIPRAKTHFYDLPPQSNNVGYLEMFLQYPDLAQPVNLSPERGVFIAGYCTHLVLDLRWYFDVLMPYFVINQEWGDHHYRFVVHNTLLTYLDKNAVDSLPEEAARILIQAKPKGWLPFAKDEDLINWRDELAAQLRPGAQLRTIEIYSDRLNMSVADFEANLETKSWMEKNLFNQIPFEDVEEMLTSVVAESIDLVSELFSKK